MLYEGGVIVGDLASIVSPQGRDGVQHERHTRPEGEGCCHHLRIIM